MREDYSSYDMKYIINDLKSHLDNFLSTIKKEGYLTLFAESLYFNIYLDDITGSFIVRWKYRRASIELEDIIEKNLIKHINKINKRVKPGMFVRGSRRSDN